MAVAAQSAALRSSPGFLARPATTTIAPPTYTPPAMPTLPAIDDSRAPNAAARAWIGQQLGQQPQMLAAQEQSIRNRAQQALAGYGGWSFAKDDPNTPQDESLNLSFDAGAGLGEREKVAVRGVRNQANASGMLYSSFTNQNIGNAVQKLSLEAQQIANQYASDLNAATNSSYNSASRLIGQWTQLYGTDAQYLTDNPPPAPDPLAGLPAAPGDGSPIVGRYDQYPDLNVLRARYPGYPLGVRQTGKNQYVVVIGAGAAAPPTKPVPAPPAPAASGARTVPPATQPRYASKLRAATAAARKK